MAPRRGGEDGSLSPNSSRQHLRQAPAHSSLPTMVRSARHACAQCSSWRASMRRWAEGTCDLGRGRACHAAVPGQRAPRSHIRLCRCTRDKKCGTCARRGTPQPSRAPHLIAVHAVQHVLRDVDEETGAAVGRGHGRRGRNNVKAAAGDKLWFVRNKKKALN